MICYAFLLYRAEDLCSICRLHLLGVQNDLVLFTNQSRRGLTLEDIPPNVSLFSCFVLFQSGIQSEVGKRLD